MQELSTQLQDVPDKGFIQEGILVYPAKIEGVMRWELPKTPSEIQIFLGLIEYYQRFIQDLSKIEMP